MKKRFFILGCDRSGTSVFRRIINAHSQIACPAETKFILHLSNMLETPQSIKGLLSMGFTRDEIMKKVGCLIDSLMDDYAKKNNKIVWAEKTTHSLFYVDLLEEIFSPDVHYIGIVRHGLDVAYSLENVTHSPFTVIDQFMKPGDDRSMTAIRFWDEQNKKLLSFQKKVGDRLKIIKYEDFTEKPEVVFKEVFEFMGVGLEIEKINNYNNYYHSSGYEDPKAVYLSEIKTNSCNYKKWDFQKQTKLWEIAKDRLESFKYKL